MGYALVAQRCRDWINDGLALLQRQVFNGAEAQEEAQRQAILGRGLEGQQPAAHGRREAQARLFQPLDQVYPQPGAVADGFIR